MALSRSFRSFSLVRIVHTPTCTLRAAPRRLFADQTGPEEGSGVVKKKAKDAKPKILDTMVSGEETPEVKRHNEHFENRPDRAANVIDDKGRSTTGRPPGGESRFPRT